MRQKRCDSKPEFKEKSFFMFRRKRIGKTEGKKKPKLLYSVNTKILTSTRSQELIEVFCLLPDPEILQTKHTHFAG